MHDPTAGLGTAVVIKHGFLALFGGMVHALSAYRSGKTKGLLDLTILTVISSFSGIMFALLALHLFPEQHYLTYASAGAGGFLGIEGLALIATRVRDMLLK